jgi:cytochrome c biogenesis protein CcdA/glutaredoxin
MKKFGIILFFVLILLGAGVVNAITIEEINAKEGSPAIIFYSSTCGHCAEAMRYIDTIKANYPEVNFQEINISNNFELVYELYEIYSVPTGEQGAVPIMFVGDKYFLGTNNIKADLKETLDSLEGETKIGGCPEDCEEKEIDLFLVLSLALVDAVNPCELAVLIILMTAILTRYPDKKKKALKAGLLFSLAIFIMYFIFGLVLVNLFSFISNSFGFAFMIIIAILAIILGILNLKDYFSYGGGGFIMEVPQKWRPKMKAIINGTTSPKGAFVVGLIVSFFLTPCTAGPYFVFSGIMAQVGVLAALPYMLIYMFIFISPMLAISFITYFGFAQVEDMEGWRSRNLQKLHLIAGAIMLIIGLWLLGVMLGLF